MATEGSMEFSVKVEGFENGATIPVGMTCEGGDVAPATSWSGEPAGTKSFALIMDDPDAPGGTWTHWLLWDIPVDRHRIEKGFRSGLFGVSGKNDFGREGYGGPCPPKGHGAHRYFFRVYALNVPRIEVQPGAKRAALDRAIHLSTMAEASYMGRFGRK
jgi:Raf kinase inhibitor-like YbhB/YbcL family protein